MAVLSISQEKCRQCYRCVQGCPTNALKIDNRKVRRIEERCILCGACYKHCPHEAVIVHTEVDRVMDLLKKGEKVVICLDPTFPAVLDKGTPGQLVTALKKIGFQEVWESACGGELVVGEYQKYLDSNKESLRISSFCPSLVLYIEKYVPEFISHLVPIVSPMIATGKLVKQLRGKDTKVVFVGSCLSRIRERMDDRFKETVDYVLTYHDLLKIFEEKRIDREEQTSSEFDGPWPQKGRLLSIRRGLSQCVGFDQNVLNLDFVVASGSKRAIRAIQQAQDGTINPKFIDLLFCRGCIDGPIVDKNISGPGRRQIVINYIKSQRKKNKKDQKEYIDPQSNLELKRTFEVGSSSTPEPEEAKIQAVLKKLHKTYPDQNLDCGSCGHETCRENAIAVVLGFSELEMCPHYLTGQMESLYARLEKSHKQLKESHTELEQTQRQLIHTEKMASVGQLAAGVAHELNNPMGTITLFGRILQKELAHNKKWEKDIGLIIQEAERAAKIIKDLLNFSRETQVKPGIVDLNKLMEEALTLLVEQSLFHNIQVKKNLDGGLPNTFADADLLKQVFLNIILNGAQAMGGKGVLSIETQAHDNRKKILIRIRDNGHGIPKKNLPHLFDPFFTTKEKGTGLGLAIVYGIVSKHKGTVRVESVEGKGTAFLILLPVLDQKEWMRREKQVVSLGQKQGGQGSAIQSKDLIG